MVKNREVYRKFSLPMRQRRTVKGMYNQRTSVDLAPQLLGLHANLVTWVNDAAASRE